MHSQREIYVGAEAAQVLAVDHEMLLPVFRRGLCDPRITLRPIVAAAGNQPHAVAVSLH
jgi:hypothetical protein